LLPPLLPLVWGAWRWLSHGTPAASPAWEPRSKPPSPRMPIVTSLGWRQGGRAVEARRHALLPCPGTPALCSPGPALFFRA